MSESNGDRQEIREGKVTIQQPKTVFYNKVQEFNRDLSILAINTFVKHRLWQKSGKNNHNVEEKGIRILDALSATGLRAVRYAKEVTSDTKVKVFANDLSAKAVAAIRENAAANAVDHLITVSNEEASLFMCKHREHEDRFMIVDIDPYGSPAPFLDAAVQCVADNGLLMVTCTDMAILCGNHSETCFAKYGSLSLKLVSCHEQALRIVLRLIESCANRYGRHILPLLSISADFYIRLFVQVFSSPLNAKKSASKTGTVYLCHGCRSTTIQPLGRFSIVDGKEKYSVNSGPVVGKRCDFCASEFHVGGPIWIDPIFSVDFVNSMKIELSQHSKDYGTFKRLEGMLQVISEELPDAVLFRTVDDLCRIIKCTSPPMHLIRSAILNAGYRVSYSHAHKASLKTDAPNDFIWDLMRKWVEMHPVNESHSKDSTPGQKILSTYCSRDISFVARNDAEPTSKKKELIRFQVNPERNWGPKPRPGRNKPEENESNSSKINKKFKLENEAPDDVLSSSENVTK